MASGDREQLRFCAESPWFVDIFQMFKISMFSVGNKCEESDRRVVLESDARNYAQSMKIAFFETSAKEDKNVEPVSFLSIES